MPSISPNINSLGSLFAARNAERLLGSSLQKLSSGLAVNTAADAPAQLIISEELRGQISGISAALRNTQEAYNVSTIAEGGAAQVSDLLTQARALAVSSANTGANSPAQVAANQKELDNILATVDRISGATNFAGQQLLNGSTPTRTFQLGPDGGAAEQATLKLPDVRTTELGTAAGGPALSTTRAGGANDLATNPNQAIKVIDQALQEVAAQRGEVGAFQQNTLQSTIQNLSVAMENITAVESNIRDLNMAEGVSNLANGQALLQTSIFGIQNSNFTQQQMLRLLG